MITINSFDTGLTQDERAKLYPTCGHLHPDGLQELRRTDSYDAVRDVAARYPVNHFAFFLPVILIDYFSNIKHCLKEPEQIQVIKPLKINFSNTK